MKGIKLGGFFISEGMQKTILVIFTVYSVAVIALGMLVHLKTRKTSRFTDFLTGGGKLNVMEVAMISAMGSMAGGTMIAGPGLTRSVGFIYTLIAISYAFNTFFSLGAFGKKIAIVKERIHGQTSVHMLHHRYQSKNVTIVITLLTIIFLMITTGAQFLNAARIFSLILGDKAYNIGMILCILVIILYSAAGGVKSLAKVCVLQGAFMIFSVIFLIGVTLHKVSTDFGSVAQAMQYLKNINDTLVRANSYTLPQAISIAIISGWANALNPSFLQVPMMYDNTKVMKRAAVISCTMAFFTYLFMTATGPLSYIINPGLSHADYSTVYLTASLMPGWMAGIVVSAIFAAIQSSVSAFVLIIAGSITKDLYVDCFGGKAEEKKLKQINMILFAVFCCLCALIALNQNQLGQLLVILSAGGIALSFGVPYFFGVYWGKATAAGALASSVGGVISYVSIYYCSFMQCYQDYLWNVNPLIPALIISIVLMTSVSLKTQDQKVPLGVYRVWFCEDYSEKYTKI